MIDPQAKHRDLRRPGGGVRDHWLEGSLYMGLLFVAGFICTLQLLGARLLPEKG